jgi:hypothetical protein
MMDEERCERLNRLWQAYRLATPEPEISANFMPELWARIEAARPVRWAMPLARLGARLLPFAAAITLAMSAYLWIPSSAATGAAGYVDVLASDLIQQQQPALWVPGGDGSI